jgi:hypothetical protein
VLGRRIGARESQDEGVADARAANADGEVVGKRGDRYVRDAGGGGVAEQQRGDRELEGPRRGRGSVSGIGELVESEKGPRDAQFGRVAVVRGHATGSSDHKGCAASIYTGKRRQE